MKVIKFVSEEKGSSFLMIGADDLNNFSLDHFEDGQKGTFEIMDISEDEYKNLPEFEGF